MGKFSTTYFGKHKLPKNCIIYAGTYLPHRKEWVRPLFDSLDKIKVRRTKYAFAEKNGTRYLVLFNVYGSSDMLQILRVLKEEGVNRIFFIGSMGAKALDVGTIVLPTSIIDRTGLVGVDKPGKDIVLPYKAITDRTRNAIKSLTIDYKEGKIISVPAVLHKMGHINLLKKKAPEILGEEMELSTYFHFSQKDKIAAYAILYVSDNKSHHITTNDNYVKESRRKGLRLATRIALTGMA